MKLKYYLRGLGVGIVLTTLIITISGSRNKISDSEIITRAMEMGMVMKEDPKGNLDEVMEATKDSSGIQTEKKAEAQKNTDGLAEAGDEAVSDDTEPAASVDDMTAAENQEQGQGESEVTGQTPSDQIPEEQEPAEQTTSAEPVENSPESNQPPVENLEEAGSPATSEEKDAGTSDKITFTVEKGMSSGQVSTMLEAKGLIESAEEFNRFILQKGKAGEIMIGEYRITGNASFDEILKVITK